MINLGSSKDKGKVSVVATFCNLDNVAGRMLNSLVNQTYKNLEIICVNDNSTDITLEVLNEFASNDERIVVLSNKETFGVSKSRNIGIDNATGKYIIVVDGDDEMLLDGIENMVRAFDENTDCVVAGFKQKTKDGAINIVMPEEKVSGSPKNEEFFETLMRYSNKSDVCCFTRMYKREVVKARYKEDCNYGEQILFAFEMLQYLNNITMLPMVVYNYSPFPYPKETLSNQAKGKEFDLMKQIEPEIINISQKMFPNNKYLAYVAGFSLVASIFMGARSLLEMGKDRQEVVSSVNAQLKDDMVQDLVRGVGAVTSQDQEVLNLIQSQDAQNVLNSNSMNEQLFEMQTNTTNKVLQDLMWAVVPSKTT